MSEQTNNMGGNILPDGPSPSQVLVAEVAVEVRGDMQYNPSERFNLPVDAHALRGSLAESSLGDLLVPPGEKLEATDDYQRTHGSVTPGEDADLSGVSIGTWYVHDEKRRIIRAGQPNPYLARTDAELHPWGDGDTEVTFPGQYDWNGYVSVTFWYKPKDGGNLQGEVLALQSTHWKEGALPTIQSRVFIIPEDPMDGTKYYVRRERPARDEAEVTLLAETIRGLIPRSPLPGQHRPGEPPFPGSPK